MSKIIKHSNGYTGILYGKRSFIIKDPNGKEVLHTGFRSCETKEAVLSILEDFPKMQRAFNETIDIVLKKKIENEKGNWKTDEC